MTASGRSRTTPPSSRTPPSTRPRQALGKAGLTTDFVSIPLTVVVLKVGDRLIMVDSGSGAASGSRPPASSPPTCKAAGIDPAKIGTILISHFHPDHIFGLMQKGTNAPTFPTPS